MRGAQEGGFSTQVSASSGLCEASFPQTENSLLNEHNLSLLSAFPSQNRTPHLLLATQGMRPVTEFWRLCWDQCLTRADTDPLIYKPKADFTETEGWSRRRATEAATGSRIERGIPPGGVPCSLLKVTGL